MGSSWASGVTIAWVIDTQTRALAAAKETKMSRLQAPSRRTRFQHVDFTERASDRRAQRSSMRQADCLCALPRRLDLENEVFDGAITPTMVRLRLDLEEACPTCTLAIESATRNVNIHRVLSN